jgi:hypothetical protein
MVPDVVALGWFVAEWEDPVRLGDIWQLVLTRLLRRHRGIKGFDEEARQAGGVGSGLDRGIKIVPTERVVGSVSRWQNLRSDFFYRNGQAMTQRFHRIGAAMRAGKALPPVELYKLKRPKVGDDSPVSEYYVVDGHHRVAMARKGGQDFLDAHVTEFKVGGPAGSATTPGNAPSATDGSVSTSPKVEDASSSTASRVEKPTTTDTTASAEPGAERPGEPRV